MCLAALPLLFSEVFACGANMPENFDDVEKKKVMVFVGPDGQRFSAAPDKDSAEQEQKGKEATNGPDGSGPWLAYF